MSLGRGEEEGVGGGGGVVAESGGVMVVFDHKHKEVEATTTRSLRLIKSKQMLVSLVALICGLFLLLRNPVLESRPAGGVSLLVSDFDNADSTAGAINAGVAPTASNSSFSTDIQTRNKSEIPVSHTYSSGGPGQCNFARGKWIYDASRPLYSGEFCHRWLSKAWQCRADKRHNFSLEHYRWQPDGCDMPAFDGAALLRRLRNKTVAFVGDSLGRQQYQSLLCMLINKRTKVVDVSGSYDSPTHALNFVRTNTTVLFYWSATLADEVPRADGEGSDLHVDRVPLFLRREIHRLDVVVLNTGHHWNRGKINANKWILRVNGQPAPTLKVHLAREMAIKSCARWLDELADKRQDLRVFIRTLSPRHFVGGEWDSGGRCDNVEPMDKQAVADFKGDVLVEETVRSLRNLKLLDITYLSKMRGESHVANLLKLPSASPVKQDCLHWCLPGVPDTWNELLYSFLTP